MDAAERLAALLAGDLDADERDALEAELARDPELRANLDSMRRADEQLQTLRSPAPSEGFEERLDAAIGAALEDVLGPADASHAPRDGTGTGSSATVTSADTFAARRRDRDSRGLRTLAGIAAAAVVVVGSGVVLTQLLDFSSNDDASTADTAEDTEEAADGLFNLEMDDDADMAGGADRFGAPVVVADDRELTDEDLDALLTSGQLDAVRSSGLDQASGRDLADRFRSALGAQTGFEPDATDGEAADEDTASDDEQSATDPVPESDDAAAESAPASPELFTRSGAPLPADAADDLARCLDELLVGAPDAIPAYAELGSYEGTEAIVFGLVTVEPDTGAFSRTEVWVFDRATCHVLRLSQG